jgi:hypothetical protein
MGGVQSHWGAWSLDAKHTPPLLILQLHGAEPPVYNGPLGPIRINWPNSETWAVLTVQQNQICFFNGLMVRRAFVTLAANGATVSDSAPILPPVPPQAPAITVPPPQYSAPPAPPPPDAHQDSILTQWQKTNADTMKAWQDTFQATQANFQQMFQSSMKATSDMNAMRQTEFTRELGQRQSGVTDFQANMEKQSQDFISKFVQS